MFLQFPKKRKKGKYLKISCNTTNSGCKGACVDIILECQLLS